jgi:hypothetical protein
MANPADLNITPQPDTDKNFFNFKAVGLKVNETYAIKFQWKYDDLTVSDWSPGFFITTSNETAPAVPSSASVPGSATGSIPVTLSAFPTNAKRVDVVITNGIFGTATVAHSFTTAGTATIAAPAGTYIVQLRSISPTGVTSTVGTTFTITIADVGETVQAPTNPNGFSIDRILSGIQVNWAGTYANGTFTGFEAIKIYVGNSATATNGSYKDAGVMTGNNVANSITIPVDGTYLRYDLPVYIHAAAVNKNGTVGTLQANVANNSLGARSAIGSDLADLIITNGKLVDDAVSAAKIATAAITTTKIADDAITTPKLVANAITADKIVSSAITADKIATNAITAGKILAGTIDVTKLAAGTISTNNLEAGVITSTSYIRAGSKNVGAGTGARVEMSSSAIEDGIVDIAAGFYIYNSAGTAILSAPLTGGLEIVGGGTFSGNLSAAGGTFTGTLSAASGSFSGTVTASSGSIGNWVINSGVLKSGTQSFPRVLLDPTNSQIVLRASEGASDSGNLIKLDPSVGIKVGTTALPKFTVDMSGNMSATDAVFNSGSFSGSITSSATITGGNLTGSTINLTGVQTGSGSGSSYTESSDTSTRLNFTNARYTIIPANDTWTETVSTPSYDSVNDEWTSTATTSTFTSNTIKFTDSVLEGGIPSSAYYYGETWYEGGTSSGSIINYVNYVGGYLGFEIRANTSEKGFYFIGDSSIAGQNWGVAHLTTSSKDQPAMLQTDQYGKVTRGRAIFTSGSSSTTILGSTWNNVGQNGDLVFSTGN